MPTACRDSGWLALRDLAALQLTTCGAPLNSCHFYGSFYYTKLHLYVQWKYNIFEKKLLDAGFWMLDTRKKYYRRGSGVI